MLVVWVANATSASFMSLLLSSRENVRCSVRVSWCVLLLLVAMEYENGIRRAYSKVKEDVVTIECGV